jgi:hypothetical protein
MKLFQPAVVEVGPPTARFVLLYLIVTQLARKLVSRRHQEKGFLVTATGIRSGDHFHLLRIE